MPRVMECKRVNDYLKQIRFKSSIPHERWEKIKPDLEMYYKQKIYSIERNRKDICMTDILLIEQELPSFIPWEDKYMIDGPRFSIGEGFTGQAVWDTSSLPHGLVAGTTGSGKTGILRCIIHQAMMKRWNVSVLDFKGGGDYTSAEREAREYQDLEQGYSPFIISDPEEARELLVCLTVEVKGRLSAFKEAGVSNIDEYNARGREQFIPWLLVIDEAAELLDVKLKDKAEKEMYSEIDHSLRTLARISRAAGIHILMGFIRPSADVLDGQIKNNLLFRCCGYFSDPAASRIVLDSDRATELPPEVKGRFIVGDEEVQAYYMPIPKPEE